MEIIIRELFKINNTVVNVNCEMLIYCCFMQYYKNSIFLFHKMLQQIIN